MKMMNAKKLAREDFEKLRDIPDMPDEALDILREWTTREEDEWEYDIAYLVTTHKKRCTTYRKNGYYFVEE